MSLASCQSSLSARHWAVIDAPYFDPLFKSVPLNMSSARRLSSKFLHGMSPTAFGNDTVISDQVIIIQIAP